jgi:electron-transferring-flavoprotein dehydrogenase
VSALLEGGQMVRYGAKALPEGGWNTIPQVFMDGALIAGDAGGYVNSMRLKGIHLAMRTGMLAAETAFEAVRQGDTSQAVLKTYQERIDASAVAELPVRNAPGVSAWVFPLAKPEWPSRTDGYPKIHGHPGHSG